MAILTITAAALACKGDPGPTGPAGTQGQQGQQGQQGPKGDSGTANVIYSNWTNFVAPSWSSVVDGVGDTVEIYSITATSLTASILANGVVLAYVRIGGSTTAEALPLVRPLSSAQPQSLDYSYNTGIIFLRFRNIANGNDPGTFTTGNSYRYILIPGGVPGISAALNAERLRSLSYDDVIQRLGVPR